MVAIARALYSENDPFVAACLRNLITARLIPDGDVDDRSIVDVRPEELDGYEQCHFFAGIAGWSEALRLAGWPTDKLVWTGSCPCQSLSVAGQRTGHLDKRHLWPAFFRLIAKRRPATVFGEQVASKDGREWFAGVRADLEAVGYACGAADLCSAGVGAPHARQRLYWVAHADHERCERQQLHLQPRRTLQACAETTRSSEDAQRLADAGGIGRQRREDSSVEYVDHWQDRGRAQGEHGPFGSIEAGPEGIANTNGARAGRNTGASASTQTEVDCERFEDGVLTGNDAFSCLSADRIQGQWREYRPRGERHRGLVGLAMQVDVPQWNGATIAVKCSDGSRRVSAQPDAFPLAHGVSARMGRLRAYGNAINPILAAEFIKASVEAIGDLR